MDNKYATDFSSILESNCEKFLIFISRKQYAVICGNDRHSEMCKKLVTKTRPNMKINDNGDPINPDDSFYNDTIVLLGYRQPLYLEIEFPIIGKITREQFICLKEVLDALKKHRLKHQTDSDYNVIVNSPTFGITFEDFKNKIDELVEKCSKNIDESLALTNEIIIGKEFKQTKSLAEIEIDELLKQMADNKIDESGNPIVQNYGEYKTMGFSSAAMLALFIAFCSITILILEMVIIIN